MGNTKRHYKKLCLPLIVSVIIVFFHGPFSEFRAYAAETMGTTGIESAEENALTDNSSKSQENPEDLEGSYTLETESSVNIEDLENVENDSHGDENPQEESAELESPGTLDAQADDSAGLGRMAEDNAGDSQEQAGFNLLELTATQVVVTSFDELKTAINGDNGYTEVYLGSDITMTGGIEINANKTSLLISGLNPEDPSQTTPHTLTQYTSSSLTDTIHLSSGSNTATVTVSDLYYEGHNYYGIIAANMSNSSFEYTHVYERVTYTGPQMAYNFFGSVTMKDCTVSIVSGQELAEATDFVFQGSTTVTTTTSSDSVFYTRTSGGTFTLEEDASLELTATSYSVSGGRGIFYASPDIAITIGENASFLVNTSAPFSYIDQATITSLTVEEGGSLIFNSSTNYGTYGMDMGSSGGDITINENATFQFLLSNTGLTTAIRLPSSATFSANNPASVVIIYPGGGLFSTAGSASNIDLTGQQCNLWSTAGDGGLDDPPAYHWQNSSGTLSITAVLTYLTMTSVSSNYDNSTGAAAPSTTTLDLIGGEVLSLGTLDLTVDPISESDNSITGTTSADAAVRASYVDSLGATVTPADVTAQSDGTYSIALGTSLPLNTEITVSSAYQYLLQTATISVVDTVTVTVAYYDMSPSLMYSQQYPVVTGGDLSFDATYTNYRAVYYTLLSEGDSQEHSVSTAYPYSIALTNLTNDETASIYFVSTQLDFTASSALEFTALLINAGVVTPDATNGNDTLPIENNSDLPISVSLLEMAVDTTDTSNEVMIVENAADPAYATYNRLNFDLTPSAGTNGLDSAVNNIIPDNAYATPPSFGFLDGVYYLASDLPSDYGSVTASGSGTGVGETGYLELGGQYYGGFPTYANRYNVTVTFTFEIDLYGY